MPARRGRNDDDPRAPLLRAAVLSAVLHAVAITLVLLAPHRLRSAPATAYTVEIVDPGAVGGKLLEGPIGGGAPAARRPAPPPPPPPEPPPPPPPPVPPEVVARAAAPEPEPVDDTDTVPLGVPRETARPVPTRAPATARPATSGPTARATAAPSPRPRPTASAVASPRRPSPVPAVTAAPAAARASAAAHPAVTEKAAPRGQPTPAADLDTQLAEAIKGVESRAERAGTRGMAGAGPGGGMGGTERTLEGPAGVGGEGPGGGGQLRGLEFVVYYNHMLSRIKERWTYVGDRADLRVTVRFSILDNGEITDIRLMERSGDPSYDASVERAVKRASPLDPPPEAYRKDFSDVELTFRPADLRRPSG